VNVSAALLRRRLPSSGGQADTGRLYALAGVAMISWCTGVTSSGGIGEPLQLLVKVSTETVNKSMLAWQQRVDHWRSII